MPPRGGWDARWGTGLDGAAVAARVNPDLVPGHVAGLPVLIGEPGRPLDGLAVAHVAARPRLVGQGRHDLPRLLRGGARRLPARGAGIDLDEPGVDPAR